MESLNLSLPRQHDLTDPTVERDVRRLRAWLSNLPLMDVAETVRMALGALDSLNEQKLDDALRFECLEAYRTTALRLFQTLDPLHIRQLALSTTRRRQAIDGMARVFRGLAGGYKLVVAGAYPRSGEAVPALLGPALHRALELSTYGLLDGYRFYREVRPQLLAESHELYRVARRHGLLGVSIAAADDESSITTAMLYHAGMLLPLLDPARLAEGEVGLLFEVLMQHAGLCEVIVGGSWEGSGAGLFAIDPQGSGLPVHCSRLESPVAGASVCLLDARAALRKIRERLDQTPEQVRGRSPEALILHSLMPEAPRRDRRSEHRNRAGRSVDLLTGLPDIHAWLLAVADGAVARDRIRRCRVLDSSPGGMKLDWENDSAWEARVGGLLGVLETVDARSQLYLAVIRNVRVLREGGMETGIQLFPGAASAVTCTLAGDAEAVPALYVHAGESGARAASLLVGKGCCAEGDRLRVNVNGRDVDVRAGRRVMETPVFERFEFRAQ